MIGARQHQNIDIPTIRMITCPACNKDRLGKYLNEDGTIGVASTKTVEVRDEKRYLEGCSFCVEKYRKADERFVMENMKKLRKAFQEQQPAGESDHTDFSLNLD